MTVSNQPGSLLDSILAAQTTNQEIGVAVLKKAQDAAKQEGEAMVKMLEQAAPPPQSSRSLLDAYA
jgi:Putative motility protein